MLVHQILASKANQKIVTIKPEATVTEAVTTLTDHRIGAVIVSADGETPVGILSERDVVRAIGQDGPSRLGDKVEAMMTRALISCGGQETSDQVLTKMSEGGFRHMPVIEDGKVVGMISIRDVVFARLSQLSMEKQALEGMIMGY